MAQVINTNIASLNAQRNLNASQSALADLAAAPVFRPAHQQRQGRRGRPGDLRTHDRADPRPEPGGAQRQRRHFAGADGRRRAGRESATTCSASANWPCSRPTPPTASTDRAALNAEVAAADGRNRPRRYAPLRSTASSCSMARSPPRPSRSAPTPARPSPSASSANAQSGARSARRPIAPGDRRRCHGVHRHHRWRPHDQRRHVGAIAADTNAANRAASIAAAVNSVLRNH